MIDGAMESHRTVIAGASIGGLTTAERLREVGYRGSITLIGAEAHLPYSRPPLSKHVLAGQWKPGDTVIVPPSRVEELDLALLLGMRATGLDTDRRVLRVGSTEVLYDDLVIATGVRARTLDTRGLGGIHSYRTSEDATRLLSDLVGARRVLVVGTGILGSELAAGLTSRGLEVTLIGRAPRLAFGQAGTLLSDLIGDLHRAHGVDVRPGTEVVEFVGDSRVAGARLTDGSTVAADVVVTAIGSLPNTEWLAGSVPVEDGVSCDRNGRAAPHVYAVGDVARWVAGPARSFRVEHQQNAIEQGRAIAETIALGRPAEATLPFFWSELYGTRIQSYGRFTGNELQIVEGAVTDGRFIAASVSNGRCTAAVGWNHPRAFRDFRVRIDSSERQLVS